MAFETGKENKHIPVALQEANTGRMVKENNGIVNAADWLAEVTDPLSSRALNITATIPTVAPIKNFRATTALGRKVHFSQGFNIGFDTANGFTCLFDDALFPESRNAAGLSSNGSIAADVLLSCLKLDVASNGLVQSTIINESKNYIKMPSTGKTYLEIQGVFEHIGDALGNTTTFSIFDIDDSGTTFISQNIWAIDTFGSGVKNPSSITLDFKKVQTAVLEYSGKNKGDIRIGFLINDTLYFAHEFKINNFADNTRTLNLPIRDEFIVESDPSVTRKIGFYNTDSGHGLASVMDTSTSVLLVKQKLNSLVCYTVGADPVEDKVPFVAGNKDIFKNVTTANTPLFSIQCAPTFNSVVNRTVYNLDSLDVFASSQNENFGCYIKVMYNATLVNDNFVALPDNAESALTYDISSTSLSSGVEIFQTSIMANKSVTFSMKDIYNNYRKEFSRNEIAGFNIFSQVLNQTLTVVASPMQGAQPTTSIDVSANISGGEVG